MKLIKKFLNSGKFANPTTGGYVNPSQIIHDPNNPYNLEIVLETDPLPEEQLENQYPELNKRVPGGTQLGNTPQLRSDLPKDHPINVRNAIAQQQGWVEVPASQIDIAVNKLWEDKIRQDVDKYGPDAKYIVDPVTRKIVTENLFNKIKTDIAWRNSSEGIADNLVKFEILKEQNRRAMKRFNDQMDAATIGLMATGAAPFIPEAVSAISASGIPTAATTVGNAIRPFIKPALASYIFASGMDLAKQDWEAGNHGLAAVDAVGAALNAVFPFSRASTLLQYAPKVGIPMAILGGTASAFAEEPYNPYPQDETDDPHDFTSKLSASELLTLKEKLNDPATNWAEMGDDEETRKYWSDLIQKELQAAYFKFSPANVNGRQVINIYGNKGEGLQKYLLAMQMQDQNALTWGDATGAGLRYFGAPVAAKTLKLVTKKEMPKFLGAVGRSIKKHPETWGYGGWWGANVLYDAFNDTSWLRKTIRLVFGDPNLEVNTWNNLLPEYYNQLINAYIMLNSRKSNVNVHGSTFSKYQTYSIPNTNPMTGLPFDRSDTTAVMHLGPTQIDDTTNTETSESQPDTIDSNLYVGN